MSLRRGLAIYGYGSGAVGTFIGLQYWSTLEILRRRRYQPGLIDHDINEAIPGNLAASIVFPITWIVIGARWKAEARDTI
jgi:hypothetical protein